MLHTSLTIYWPAQPSQSVRQYVMGIPLVCYCGLLEHRGLLGITLPTHSSWMPTYVVANLLKRRNCGSKLRFRELFNICVVLHTYSFQNFGLSKKQIHTEFFLWWLAVHYIRRHCSLLKNTLHIFSHQSAKINN